MRCEPLAGAAVATQSAEYRVYLGHLIYLIIHLIHLDCGTQLMPHLTSLTWSQSVHSCEPLVGAALSQRSLINIEFFLLLLFSLLSPHIFAYQRCSAIMTIRVLTNSLTQFLLIAAQCASGNTHWGVSQMTLCTNHI